MGLWRGDGGQLWWDKLGPANIDARNLAEAVKGSEENHGSRADVRVDVVKGRADPEADVD